MRRGDDHRDICLIPSSAHGTNAASAVLAGMKVEVVRCRANGDVDLDDLRAKIADHAERLAAIMITYPSTHGVYEHEVAEFCALVHDAGGQVYVDGANLNALVGLARPGRFGGDVSHLNLHKTSASRTAAAVPASGRSRRGHTSRSSCRSPDPDADAPCRRHRTGRRRSCRSPGPTCG